MHTPRPGQRVGEYELDRPIGRGRFGHVWLARHHVFADRVAAAKLPTDPAYLRALHHEGRVLDRLGDHPNVARCVALDPYADPPYLLAEYVDGSSLRPLVERRLLDVGPALAVLEQVLAGLAHAHGRGVAHGDVKPENVLVDRRAGPLGFDAPGVVKLGDFGLSRLAAGTAAAGADGLASILYSGSMNGDRPFAGTPGYMAPEVLEGGVADALSDVYACGVMLFEMLTGRRPVGAASLDGLNLPLAARLEELISRSYAPRERRFASAAAFLAAVHDLRFAVASSPAARPDGGSDTRPEPPGADPGSARRVDDDDAVDVASAEARARVEAARAAQHEAEARAGRARADRAAADARGEAAAADRARRAAERLDAEAERTRAKARADAAKQEVRIARERLRDRERLERAGAAQAQGDQRLTRPAPVGSPLAVVGRLWRNRTARNGGAATLAVLGFAALIDACPWVGTAASCLIVALVWLLVLRMVRRPKDERRW